MKLSYCHRGGEAPLLGETIAGRFLAIADQHPQVEAIVSAQQQRRLSYRELSQAVDQVACGLIALGFNAGDRIGIWSTNNIEWFQVQLACARIGAVLVNINPAYRPAELAYALKSSELNGLITIPAFRSSHYVEMLLELLPELSHPASPALNSAELPLLRQVILFDPERPMTTATPAAGFVTWQTLITAGEQIDATVLERATAAVDIDDPANIQYTSGTTGSPKAVVLTHHNILNNAWFAAQAMQMTHEDRLCVSVPFYHCFGIVLSNLVTLSVGATLVLPAEHFDPLTVLQTVEQEKCTILHGVPTMFIAELDHPRFAEFNMQSLRTGIMAGAPCPPSLLTRVMEQMHCAEILVGYGETEASPLTHLTDRNDSFERRIESVGTNLPHQEVKIVDVESGATLPVGEIGEICFRGYHVMAGYYGNAVATAEAINPHGWLYSGDLGTMDDQGYVKITGRRKEMLIRGGENIYPREIEEVIFAHPEVVEVAVFGVPDDYFGEEVAAWVKLKQGSTITADELADYCREHLAHFKIPKTIRFVTDFPMTVTGKLQKFEMQAVETAEQQAKKN